MVICFVYLYETNKCTNNLQTNDCGADLLVGKLYLLPAAERTVEFPSKLCYTRQLDKLTVKQ